MDSRKFNKRPAEGNPKDVPKGKKLKQSKLVQEEDRRLTMDYVLERRPKVEKEEEESSVQTTSEVIEDDSDDVVFVREFQQTPVNGHEAAPEVLETESRALIASTPSTSAAVDMGGDCSNDVIFVRKFIRTPLNMRESLPNPKKRTSDKDVRVVDTYYLPEDDQFCLDVRAANRRLSDDEDDDVIVVSQTAENEPERSSPVLEQIDEDDDDVIFVESSKIIQPKKTKIQISSKVGAWSIIFIGAIEMVGSQTSYTVKKIQK